MNTTMKTVEINNQIWSEENFKGTICPDGTELVLNRDYFYPDGNEAAVDELGLLYTWDAAKRVCPEGWHLPTPQERFELMDCDDIAEVLQFRPAGYKFNGGIIRSFHDIQFIWGDFSFIKDYREVFTIERGKTIGADSFTKEHGLSVRFVKNK